MTTGSSPYPWIPHRRDDRVGGRIDAGQGRAVVTARRPYVVLAEGERTAGTAQGDLDRGDDLVRRRIDSEDAGHVRDADPHGAEPETDLVRTAGARVAGRDRRHDLVGRRIDAGDSAAAMVRHPDGVVAGGTALRVRTRRDGRDHLESRRVDAVHEVGVEVVEPEPRSVRREMPTRPCRVDHDRRPDRIRCDIDRRDRARAAQHPEIRAIGCHRGELRDRDGGLGRYGRQGGRGHRRRCARGLGDGRDSCRRQRRDSEREYDHTSRRGTDASWTRAVDHRVRPPVGI